MIAMVMLVTKAVTTVLVVLVLLALANDLQYNCAVWVWVWATVIPLWVTFNELQSNIHTLMCNNFYFSLWTLCSHTTILARDINKRRKQKKQKKKKIIPWNKSKKKKIKSFGLGYMDWIWSVMHNRPAYVIWIKITKELHPKLLI